MKDEEDEIDGELVEQSDKPLIPKADMDLEAQVQKSKQEASLVSIDALKDELLKRKKNDRLAEEFGNLRATQIIFHLTKLIAALKGPSAMVAIQINKPNADQMRAYSPQMMTPHERQLMHKKMDRKTDNE